MTDIREGKRALDRIIELLPDGAIATIDPPLLDSGVWNLDVTLGGVKEVLEWYPKRGYALYSDIGSAYGERPDIYESDPAAATTRLLEIIATHPVGKGPGTLHGPAPAP